MKFIEITVLENGSHRNQTIDCKITPPHGWAVIPDGMETPNFPFGEIEVENINGVSTVTKWIAGTIPESETLTHEEINKMIVAKIREQYDVNEEFKMINIGIADPENEQYKAYRSYVSECIAWGDTLETE